MYRCNVVSKEQFTFCSLHFALSLLEKFSLLTKLEKLLQDAELDSSKQMSTCASISVSTYISLHIGHLCEGIE